MNITPMKILMVHGNKEERGQLAIMLARFEHGVEFASEISLPKFNLDNYDLIIVDEDLSDGSGIVLLQQFSAINRSKTIFLSSGGEKERAFYQSSLGIYECMGKPVKPMDLAVIACDFYVSAHLNDWRLEPLSC
jgi:DNA-binding response OmpR family regulator